MTISTARTATSLTLLAALALVLGICSIHPLQSAHAQTPGTFNLTVKPASLSNCNAMGALTVFEMRNSSAPATAGFKVDLERDYSSGGGGNVVATAHIPSNGGPITFFPADASPNPFTFTTRGRSGVYTLDCPNNIMFDSFILSFNSASSFTSGGFTYTPDPGSIVVSKVFAEDSEDSDIIVRPSVSSCTSTRTNACIDVVTTNMSPNTPVTVISNYTP